MWNPLQNTHGRDPLEPDLNDPDDRKDWNSDDEEFDEFGRKKSKKKRKPAPADTKAPAKRLASRASSSGASQAPQATLTEDGRPRRGAADTSDDSRAQFAAWAAEPPKATAPARQMTTRGPAFDKPAFSQATIPASKFATLGKPAFEKRLSSRDAAMAVAERGAGQWNAGKQQNKGANTGANMIHLRKQWKPTVPCKWYNEGLCQSGSNCTFLHEKAEVCKFLLHGRCMKGASCDAYHPPPEESKPGALFTDFETGDPTSGLDFAPSGPSGQTLMDKIWQDKAAASASTDKKQDAYADANPTLRGVKSTTSQILMEKLAKMKQQQAEKMSASHSLGKLKQAQSPATQEAWGWQQQQVNAGAASQTSRVRQSLVEAAAKYLGRSTIPPNQLDDDLIGAPKTIPIAPVAKIAPVEPEEDLSEEVVQQRLADARENAVKAKDINIFLREVEALKQYIADDEIAPAKKFVQDEVNAQINLTSMNQNLQNLGRPAWK